MFQMFIRSDLAVFHAFSPMTIDFCVEPRTVEVCGTIPFTYSNVVFIIMAVVHIFDVGSGLCLSSFKAHSAGVTSVALVNRLGSNETEDGTSSYQYEDEARNRHTIITSSQDRSIRTFNSWPSAESRRSNDKCTTF